MVRISCEEFDGSLLGMIGVSGVSLIGSLFSLLFDMSSSLLLAILKFPFLKIATSRSTMSPNYTGIVVAQSRNDGRQRPKDGSVYAYA